MPSKRTKIVENLMKPCTLEIFEMVYCLGQRKKTEGIPISKGMIPSIITDLSSNTWKQVTKLAPKPLLFNRQTTGRSCWCFSFQPALYYHSLFHTGTVQALFQFFCSPFGNLTSHCHVPNGEKMSLPRNTLCGQSLWFSRLGNIPGWAALLKALHASSWLIALSNNRNWFVPAILKGVLFTAVKVINSITAWSWPQPFQEILTRKEIRVGSSSLLHLVH